MFELDHRTVNDRDSVLYGADHQLINVSNDVRQDLVIHLLTRKMAKIKVFHQKGALCSFS
jgi:hypothetical protein